MGSIDERFTIGTLFLCIIIFIILLCANSLAVSVRNDLEKRAEDKLLENPDIADAIKQEILNNRENESNIDLWDILGGIGDIAFGMAYPFPFSLIIAVVNSLLLLIISICIALFVKEWIPLI